MNTSPPAEPSADHHELGRRARGIAAVLWSGFLSAALATMLCFAFIDPLGLISGDTPEWWSSRLRVYAIGFFFFWLVGAVAAMLCWQLLQTGREE